MFNAHQQMAQAQLIFLEQNLMTSQIAIQQLRTYLGLPSQQQPYGPFNPNMGTGYQGATFGQQQRQGQRMNPTSWIIGIEVNPNNPQELRIAQATLGQQQTSSMVLYRDDFMKFVSNSGMTGQVIAGHIAATAHIRSELIAWEVTESQTLLTVLGVGSALFDTSFVKTLPNVRMHDIRIKEKPQTDLKPSAFWIESLKSSLDNEYFNIEFMKLGEVQSLHSYNTGFGNQRYTERYTHHGLFELGMKADDLLSRQISTLVTVGKLTADVVNAFRLDTDHVLISVKSLGVAILTTGVLEHLHESIEVMDLRRVSTAATIKVDSELLDPLKRGPMGGHETGLSIEDLRGMAEESENSQPPVVNEGKSVINTTPDVDKFPTDPAGNVADLALDGVASLSYDPENVTEKLGGLAIDDVIFVGSAKTAFHQQYKFTYQHPTSGKLNVGVKPELLDAFIMNESDPITNRGLAVIIGKQNKLAFSDPKKAVFTLITFKESDNAIIQLIADTTRTYTMSKFDLARVADKITDSTYLRQIHVE